MKKQILFSCNTGSSMYGLTTKNSDTDTLIVYKPTLAELIDSHFNKKSMRYYENVIDKDEYNRNTSKSEDILYMDIFTFINEYFDGSPNAYEVVCNKSFIQETNLGMEVLMELKKVVDIKKYALAYQKMAMKYYNRYNKSKRGKDLYHTLRSCYNIKAITNSIQNNDNGLINVNNYSYIKDDLILAKTNVEELLKKEYMDSAFEWIANNIEQDFESANNINIEKSIIDKKKEEIKKIILKSY